MVSDTRPLLRGRYRLLGQLASSSANQVFVAEDARRSGRLCALKVCQVESARTFAAAQREFEILRRLRHPGVAEVFDFGALEAAELQGLDLPEVASGQTASTPPRRSRRGRGQNPPEALAAQGSFAYIASVYYEGLHLRQAYMRLFFPPAGHPADSGPTQESRWQAFLEALALICEALDVVHSHGLIHYDIKPENLLLLPRHGATTTHYDAKVLDFGLSDSETTPLGDGVRGTVPFIAPELLRDGVADRRSDLFSLGVAIAYAITGRFPFPGNSPKRWLASARGGRLEPLEPLCPHAPPRLLELIHDLCQPEPDDRPQDALAVVSRLEQAGCVRNRPRKQVPGRLVPRTAWRTQLGELQHEVEKLKRGDAEESLLLFEGKSGHFPHEFLDEVEALTRMEQVRVYNGNCRLPRNFVLQPFAEILAKVALDLDLGVPRYARYRAALNAFSPLALPAGDPPPTLPPHLGCQRFLDTVTEFFLDLSRQTPLVLCLRDLHLGGRESLDLLTCLARNAFLHNSPDDETPGAEPGDAPRLLLVATYEETEGVRESELRCSETVEALRELGASRFVKRSVLANLGPDQVPEWLRERAPQLQLSGEFVRRLHERSFGVPRLVDEFARRALRDGDRQGPGTIKASPETLLSLPERAEDAMVARSQILPASQRELLDILATAHGGLAVKDLSDLPGLLWRKEGDRPGTLPHSDAERVFEHLRNLENNGFLQLREGPDGTEAVLCTPEFAEQVYRQLDGDERARIHDLLARVLQGLCLSGAPGRIPEDVAFHTRLGTTPKGFLDPAVEAADKLWECGALHAAAHAYEEILERLAPLSEATGEHMERLVNQRLAEIYFDSSQIQKAFERLTVLSSLLEGSGNTVERAAVYRRMGEACQQSGKLGNAGHFLETSLSLLREAASASASHAQSRANGSSHVSEQLLLTLLALARYRLIRDELEQAEVVLRECVQLARGSAGHGRLLCEAHKLQADIDRRTEHHDEGLALNLKALAIAREESDPVLLAETLGVVGSNYVARGDYDEAIVHFEQRLEVARALRSKAELAHAYNSIGRVYYNRSDHERALEYYGRSLRLQKEIGDLRGIANSYNNLGLVYQVRDELPKASECFKRAIDLFTRTNDGHGMAAGMNNLASALELEGNYAEAIEYSFRALDKRKKMRSRAGVAFCYYHIAKTYQARGELHKASSYATKGMQLRQQLGEKLGIAYSRLQLSELRIAQANYGESLELCRQALQAFEGLENELGALLARGTLAKTLLRAGQIAQAKEILLAVLARASKLGQKRLQGNCLQQLASVAFEENQWHEAEQLIHDAERVFRLNQSRRDLASTLLRKCLLELDQGRHESLPQLDQAYSLLEQMGVRDLVPTYFLLRGRLELEGPSGDIEKARKFLERGLVETRELNLPDDRWRFHFRLGLLERRGGDAKLARIHFEEARRLLDDASSTLPEELREAFYALRERTDFRDAEFHPEAVTAKPSAAPESPPEARPVRESSAVAVVGEAEEHKLNQEALKLHDIAAAMGSEPDLRKLLECILDAVLELVHAERGFVILKRPGGQPGFVVARNLDQEHIVNPEHKVSNSIAAGVLSTGESVLARNALEEKEFTTSRSVQDLKLRSLVCVPMRFRRAILGIIYIDHRHRSNAFDESSRTALQAFADQAAVAVKNADLIEQNRCRAAELAQANRQKEILNLKLRQKVRQRTAQLALTKESLRQRQIELEGRHVIENIVGKSPAMLEIFDLVARLSSTTIPVLLEGESGTGKELLARSIHYGSLHKEGRFVSESCGALSESLLESELFGHTRGAFTGAFADQKGLFELADGGTLFLDAVSDTPSSMQQKLLRVLQEGEVRRVGDKAPTPVNVRIICASSKPLKELVDAGEFRDDLYYRLNGVCIRLPGLRERKEDIPLLIEHFLQEEAAKTQDSPRVLLPEATRALMRYDWPGNVRELRHFIEKTLLVTSKRVLGREDLLLEQHFLSSATSSGESAGAPRNDEAFSGADFSWSSATLRSAREAVEKEFLRRKLDANQGKVSAAARDAGVSRETFYRLLRKYGLDAAASK